PPSQLSQTPLSQAEKAGQALSRFPAVPPRNEALGKKIRGKLSYFGPWDDPQGALAKYLDQKDALHAGRTPRVEADGLTVADLVNRFLASKRHLLDTPRVSRPNIPGLPPDRQVHCQQVRARSLGGRLGC